MPAASTRNAGSLIVNVFELTTSLGPADDVPPFGLRSKRRTVVLVIAAVDVSASKISTTALSEKMMSCEMGAFPLTSRDKRYDSAYASIVSMLVPSARTVEATLPA